jgi:hypothetical protein
MRRLAICIALTAWLVPAGAAVAKEPVAAKVCGKSDCRTVKDRQALLAFTEGGSPTDPPAGGAPWYRVRVTIAVDEGQRQNFSFVIVPAAGLIRAGDPNGGYSWMPVSATAERVYREVTRDIAPFSADSLRAVGRTERKPFAADQPKRDEGGSPLPWIAGGIVVLLGLALVLILRRGLPWPRPA